MAQASRTPPWRGVPRHDPAVGDLREDPGPTGLEGRGLSDDLEEVTGARGARVSLLRLWHLTLDKAAEDG